MRLAHFLALAALAFAPAAAHAAPADAFGLWVTGDGDGHVEIAPCGESACGRIVGGADTGRPATDTKSPNRALRARPLMGLQILEGFARTSAGLVNGKIYDPDTGATYRSELLPRPDGTLALKGCVGPFCRTEIWRRMR